MYEQNSFEPVARIVQLASLIEKKRLADIAYETRRFVRIGESEETINQRIADNSKPLINIYHYHCNHLGTPQELTNQDGDVIWLSYDRAWGGSFETIYKPQFIDNWAISESELQPIKFQGQSLDIETGLHHNRFRYYDSDVGMFISRDPIGLLGGVNVFAYAPNPVMWIDPWGLSRCNETAKDVVEETTRVRHYTNRKGSNGIEAENKIIAQDNNRVYVEPAKKKALSQIDAETKYQIKPGRGRDYVEFDVPNDKLEWVKNPRYHADELTVKGDIDPLVNPKFTRR